MATRRLSILLLAPALAAGALAAAPATAPQAAIAARQANYKKMGAAMKAVSAQLKSDAPVPAIVLDGARTIAAIAPQQMRLFPAGSGAAPGMHSAALPAVWSDRATFDNYGTRLVAESAKLATVAAGTDIAATRVQWKALGAVCSGCHRQFRSGD